MSRGAQIFGALVGVAVLLVFGGLALALLISIASGQ
jgi:hypothetical protein